jgi:ABC-type glycerol-3-phosphate transport system permease component
VSGSPSRLAKRAKAFVLKARVTAGGPRPQCSTRCDTDNYGLPIWHLQLAATTLAVVPVLLIYVMAQRHVVQSFTMSGVKG